MKKAKCPVRIEEFDKGKKIVPDEQIQINQILDSFWRLKGKGFQAKLVDFSSEVRIISSSSGESYCPVTAHCFFKTGRNYKIDAYKSAAVKAGISPSVADLVAGASDRPLCRSERTEAPVRRALLAVMRA